MSSEIPQGTDTVSNSLPIRYQNRRRVSVIPASDDESEARPQKMHTSVRLNRVLGSKLLVYTIELVTFHGFCSACYAGLVSVTMLSRVS